MDKIFKIGLLVLGFGYLAYLFCPITNQVGRYQYYYADSDPKASIVFDTSTGMIYSVSLEEGRITFDVNKQAKQGDKDEQLIYQQRLDDTMKEMKQDGQIK